MKKMEEIQNGEDLDSGVKGYNLSAFSSIYGNCFGSFSNTSKVLQINFPHMIH